ncbi:MAG: TIGR04063 family PEP-CTERM/XrtA system glycosyltransferase [Candidatus Rokuibacteriota bacterium]
MKVLHVLDHSLPVGSGYSYRSRSIVLFQKRLGLEPVVLTSPKHGGARDDREVLDGIPHYRTGPGGGRLPVVRELRLMVRLARRILQVAREHRVDVIHAHSPLLNGLPALWVGRRLGLRTVYEVRTFWEDAAVSHGTHGEGSLRYRVSRALETVVLRRADVVVAICGGIRSELISRGIPARRITVVPNGVDPDWFEARPRAAALAARLGIGEGPVFGYIGSFSHYEGLSFLLEAAPGFMGAFPGSRLLLVGDGRDRAKLDEAARRAGPGVILTGRLPQPDVRDIYTLLDVFILPRRRIRLTEMVTPLKPLEAMAAGTAVLASDIGGHTELINDGHTGLLFKAESRESLTTQAIRLGADLDLRRHLVAGGRRFVESERTWDRIVAGYIPAYQGTA